MPLADTDIKLWTSVNNPENDTGTGGGAIQDAAHASGGIKPVIADISAVDNFEVVSDDAADTSRTITAAGRASSGAPSSEGPTTLTGTTQVVSTNQYERVSKFAISAKHATRTVTFRKASDNVLLATIGPNELSAVRLFINAASAVGQLKRYQLLYFKNQHATLAANNPKVRLTADPASRIKFALRTSKGDGATITNRLTVPGSIGTITDDSVYVDVPTNVLSAGEYIGVWMEQDLPGGDAPVDALWTLELSCESA